MISFYCRNFIRSIRTSWIERVSSRRRLFLSIKRVCGWVSWKVFRAAGEVVSTATSLGRLLFDLLPLSSPPFLLLLRLELVDAIDDDVGGGGTIFVYEDIMRAGFFSFVVVFDSIVLLIYILPTIYIFSMFVVASVFVLYSSISNNLI